MVVFHAGDFVAMKANVLQARQSGAADLSLGHGRTANRPLRGGKGGRNESQACGTDAWNFRDRSSAGPISFSDGSPAGRRLGFALRRLPAGLHQIDYRSSFHVDRQGFPHVAYGGDHAYYATCNGATWLYEIVDRTRGVGSFASLALDSVGRPHVAYRDEVNNAIRYAFRDSAGWHVEVVDANAPLYFGSGPTSLAMADDGTAHLAYVVQEQGPAIRYAFRDATGWHGELIGTGLDVSLALDHTGSPHVVYGEYDMLYAFRDATGWHAEMANADCMVSTASLALDAEDQAHVACYRYDGGPAPELSVLYNYRDAAGWHAELIERTASWTNTYSSSIALDATGDPHVSFFGGQDGDLRFAHRHLGVWQTEAAYPWSIAGQFSSLDLDAQGKPWIAFYDPGQLLLRYAHRAPDGWQADVIQASVRRAIAIRWTSTLSPIRTLPTTPAAKARSSTPTKMRRAGTRRR